MNPDCGALLTDLYELTMLQGYWQHEMYETAVFEFFVRKLPKHRNFLVAGGLEQAIGYLEGLAFSPTEIEWLEQTRRFQPEFVRWLRNLRFTGDVNAMPEGTVFFADEPILQVIAPLPEAQFVETRLINLLNFQTTIASKAARSVLVAPGKLLVDFGLRRAQGAEAGLMAARATYLAGFSGTSTVLASQRFEIPIYGTMAHSFVQAHPDEMTAFMRFAEANPGNVVLLIDTYDTEAAAEKLVSLAAPQLKQRGIDLKAVRIDSGDLGVTLARFVRYWITVAWAMCRFSPAATSTNMYCATSLRLGPQSMASVSARVLILRWTLRISTEPTNYRNTVVVPVASVPREKQPGRAGNRFTAHWTGLAT
jgi:nicotinate phosphoribosyltransferase